VGHFFGELVGFNIVYQDGLVAAADLADALGNKTRAEFYRRKADYVRSSMNKRLWDNDRKLYADYRKDEKLSKTHHAIFQIAAVHHHAYSKDQYEPLMAYLINDLGLPAADKVDYPLYTFGYYYYLIEVLFNNGRDKEAVKLIRDYFGSWLDKGTTTFGEHYRTAPNDSSPEATPSMSLPALDWEYEVHGYGTSAHPHFYQNILGVRPAEPGFKKILIAPRPGDLAWAKGKVSTVAGVVEVSWKQSGDRFELEANIPETSTADVRVPKQFSKVSLKINGKEVPHKPE